MTMLICVLGTRISITSLADRNDIRLCLMMHGDPQTSAMDWPVGERLMAESSATQYALHMCARVPSPSSMLGTNQSLQDVPLQIQYLKDRRVLTVTHVNEP